MTAARGTGGKGGGAVLEAQQISKWFGGLAALRDVSVTFAPGEVHAVIGPNGAGKTTLTNLLSGDMPPTSGRILLDGRDIAGLPAWRISQLGIGRSYQRTNIFPSFTVWRNCWLAAQSRLPSSFRFFRRAGRARGVAPRVERALEMAGLAERAHEIASEMSHGAQRQLEIAMMLATEPKVLLLDEPMAGMGPEESEQVVDLIRRLAADHTVVLIEHDMDAVFAVASQVTVMVNGTVLASSAPADIRQNAAVREAYLGDSELDEDAA